MRLGIFTLYHKDPVIPLDNGPFYALHMQSPPAVACPRLPVERPDHILDRQSYCEIRGHHYVWKNLLHRFDYVGFQHYRRVMVWPTGNFSNPDPVLRQLHAETVRYSSFQALTIDRDSFLSCVRALNALTSGEVERLRAVAAAHDAILPYRTVRNVPPDEHYAGAHVREHFDVLMEEILKEPFFARLRPLTPFQQYWDYFGNLFVLRAELFDDYMSLAMPILERVAGRIEIPADPYQSRVMGFLAERLFTFYMYGLELTCDTLRVRHTSFALSEDTNV